MSNPEVKPYTRVPGDGRDESYDHGAVHVRLGKANHVLTADEANDLRIQLQTLWINGKLQ